MVCFSPSPLKCFICPNSICPQVLSTLMLASPPPQTHKQSTAKDSALCNTIRSGWENYRTRDNGTGISQRGAAREKGHWKPRSVTSFPMLVEIWGFNPEWLVMKDLGTRHSPGTMGEKEKGSPHCPAKPVPRGQRSPPLPFWLRLWWCCNPTFLRLGSRFMGIRG